MPGWLNPANYGVHSRQHLGHTFRYYLAKGFLRSNDTVLDAACGCGYGAQILADIARVYAWDSDDTALARGKDQYPHDNIIWKCVDLDTVKSPNVDVTVSFETIEHIKKPKRFVKQIQKRTSRLIILSAPVIPTIGVNPNHRHDFTEQDLRDLVLVPPWTLYEEVRQGPYLVIVAYRK